MSSYTPNIGLENPAYLSQNNTWGTTENTGRSIVDNAVCGRATFNLTGTTLTIAITNGAVTSAAARYWIFTGTPGGAVTVTFAPNTAQNVVYVSNFSSQPITFTQGSGTNVTIVAGAGNIVFFDGTGAGANASLFQPTPTQPPGSVTNPSYSFTGYTDVGLYVPGTHTLGIAANGVELAQFQSSGAGPSGLNTLGATLGPYIGNALSNLDLFAGGWTGPACPPGYSFIFLNEANGEVYIKYMDSTNTQQLVLVGNYNPSSANLANYAGSSPVSIPNRNYWFTVNESTGEVDFNYKNSSGTSFTGIPVCSYVPGNIATYVGTAPATVNLRNNYFTVDETSKTLRFNYLDSTGTSWGPIVLAGYGPAGAWTTYTPTFSASSSHTLVLSQGTYIQTGKSVTVQIFIHITNGSGSGTDTYTISLPVAPSGTQEQTIYAGFGQTTNVTIGPPVILSSSSFTVGATLNSLGDVYLQFAGTYQSS